MTSESTLNLSLVDRKSAEKALKIIRKEKALVPEGIDRFDNVAWVNRSSFATIVLCLFQGFDEVSVLYPGYVHETEVIIGGHEILPGGHSSVVLEPKIKCLATRVKCSAHIKELNGVEYDVHWRDALVEDPENEYIEGVEFRFINQGSNNINTLVGFSVDKKPGENDFGGL